MLHEVSLRICVTLKIPLSVSLSLILVSFLFSGDRRLSFISKKNALIYKKTTTINNVYFHYISLFNKFFDSYFYPAARQQRRGYILLLFYILAKASLTISYEILA